MADRECFQTEFFLLLGIQMGVLFLGASRQHRAGMVLNPYLPNQQSNVSIPALLLHFQEKHHVTTAALLSGKKMHIFAKADQIAIVACGHSQGNIHSPSSMSSSLHRSLRTTFFIPMLCSFIFKLWFTVLMYCTAVKILCLIPCPVFNGSAINWMLYWKEWLSIRCCKPIILCKISTELRGLTQWVCIVIGWQSVEDWLEGKPHLHNCQTQAVFLCSFYNSAHTNKRMPWKGHLELQRQNGKFLIEGLIWYFKWSVWKRTRVQTEAT